MITHLFTKCVIKTERVLVLFQILIFWIKWVNLIIKISRANKQKGKRSHEPVVSSPPLFILPTWSIILTLGLSYMLMIRWSEHATQTWQVFFKARWFPWLSLSFSSWGELIFWGRWSKSGVLLYKMKCKDVLWVKAWQDPLDLTAMGNSWRTGLPTGLCTCVPELVVDSKWHRWLWTWGGVDVGREEFQKSGLLTPPKQNEVVLTAGADPRCPLEPCPGRHSEDSVLSYLCLWRVKGREISRTLEPPSHASRPEEAIKLYLIHLLPFGKSSISSLPVTPESDVHYEPLGVGEQWFHNVFLWTTLIVCSSHTSESGNPWCWLLMPHPILPRLPSRSHPHGSCSSGKWG